MPLQTIVFQKMGQGATPLGELSSEGDRRAEPQPCFLRNGQSPSLLVSYQKTRPLTVSKQASLELCPRPRQRQCLWKPFIFNGWGPGAMPLAGRGAEPRPCFARVSVRGSWYYIEKGSKRTFVCLAR